MSWLIVLSVLIGLLAGNLLLGPSQIALIARLSPWALTVLLFCIGFDLALDRQNWQRFRQLGWRVLLVPLSGIIGSLLGSLSVAWLADLTPWEALSVGAGFGWYSLSGVLLNSLGFSRLGAIAFLSNVLRELMTVLLIPWLSRRFDPLIAIAPGGATTMDTTLPLIARYGNTTATLAAFVNGAVLSSLVPLLVPFFARLI